MAVRSPPSSSGTTFTGSIAATQVAFGSGTNAFAGSANLTFNATGSLISGPLLTFGSGTTSTAGWTWGSATSGYAYQWSSVDGAATAANYRLRAGPSGESQINGPTASGTIVLAINNTSMVQVDSTSMYSFSNGVTALGKSNLGFKSIYLDYTNTATVGPVTINKAGGKVNLAALGTSLTLTNSVITVNSRLILTLASNPGNAVAVALSYVPSAGSAIITATPAVTNQTIIDFTVINAD